MTAQANAFTCIYCIKSMLKLPLNIILISKIFHFIIEYCIVTDNLLMKFSVIVSIAKSSLGHHCLFLRNFLSLLPCWHHFLATRWLKIVMQAYTSSIQHQVLVRQRLTPAKPELGFICDKRWYLALPINIADTDYSKYRYQNNRYRHWLRLVDIGISISKSLADTMNTMNNRYP